jgi:hypothetical protein
MTYKPFRLGTAKVFLPKRTSTQLSATLVQSLTWTASAQTAGDIVQKTANPSLEAGAQYYVTIAPLGEDRTNGGLTCTKPAPMSGPISITDPLTQTITLAVAASSFPTNMENAFAMTVWMKKGSGNWKRQGYGYIDGENGFNYSIDCEPMTSAQGYTESQLYSITNDDEDLGDRSPYTVEYVQLTPKTAEGLQIDRNPTLVTVSPDTSQDAQLKSASGAALRFRLLSNSMKDIVNANGGTYSSFTSRLDGSTIKQSQMSLQTAVAQLTGNLPFKVVYPIDSSKVAETKIFLNCVAEPQTSSSEQWGRDNVMAVEYTINGIAFDTYLQDVHAEVGNSRQAT